VSSDDDSTSESSSSSYCCIDFSFKKVAEEATVVYAGLQRTAGDTHRCLHSMLYLGNSHVLAGAKWWKQAATFSLWMGSDQESHVVNHERFLGMVHNIFSCVLQKQFHFDFEITTEQLRCKFLTSPLLRTRLDYWRGNLTWLLCSRTFRCCRS
jgi:hypothetical protein